ncbi:MAG: TonB-dependent receptor plug domain-containing protein [Hyphomonas sp.]|nr:TonB-dependent receptor plug domain-containing protein [Hyphomonas sp.]
MSPPHRAFLSIALGALAPVAAAQSAPLPDTSSLPEETELRRETITVTARRVSEDLQDVPIPVSVLTEDFIAESGAFNVGRLREFVPTLQFYSTNPRNTSINIRGLGAPYGLTNDGLDAGVGLYVDGVFLARPAAATLDFIDVSQIEVLRGPQGTLFGKNTTAGAINITTKKPSFTPESEFELTYGNLGYIQAKASITGPLTDKVAGKLSFSGTQRDGTLYNVTEQNDINDLNNLGVRGQLLFNVTDTLEVILAADSTRQRPNGYALVPVGVAPTLRAANRQYPALAAFFGYSPPSFNAFDRLTDADTYHQSNQDFGGASITANWEIGPGTLTSITAWRLWNWGPSNDRDFLGLPITTVSANPSEQTQWTQELRYAGDLNDSLSFVLGAFAFAQEINSTGLQEQGSAAARWLLAPSAAALTPGLLDGYGQTSDIRSENTSAALFGQLEWQVTDKLRLLPGLRLNYDEKSVDYDAQVFGGLQTTSPALIALQRSILAPLAYTASADDTNVSGQITAAYEINPEVNLYATYATAFKPVGLNLSGIPTNASGAPAIELATVKPEDVRHIEFGLKSTPFDAVTANLTVYETEIQDYQVGVVNAQIGVLRGYLANAEKVRVRGVEFDGRAQVSGNFSTYASLAWTDGKYVSFPDAPPALENTGGPQAVDISGTRLPGISEWAASLGGEVTQAGGFLGRDGEYFTAVDAFYRSDFSSSPTESAFLTVDGYTTLNGRIGFRGVNGWDVFLWGKNLLDEEYFELLAAQPGNSGLYVGQPADPRTYGVTLRARF